MLYLVHQKRDGSPVGVFNEINHFYLPGNEGPEKYGVAVMRGRGDQRPWEEWVDDLASSTPRPKAKWTAVELPEAPLPDILTELRDTAVTGEE